MFILAAIYIDDKKGKGISTWRLAKTFSWPDKTDFLLRSEAYRFYASKTALIRARLLELAKDGLISICKKNDKVVYELVKEKFIKRHKIEGNYRLCVQIKRKDGKFVIIEI